VWFYSLHTEVYVSIVAWDLEPVAWDVRFQIFFMKKLMVARRVNVNLEIPKKTDIPLGDDGNDVLSLL
jgi:hypothetical protein